MVPLSFSPKWSDHQLLGFPFRVAGEGTTVSIRQLADQGKARFGASGGVGVDSIGPMLSWKESSMFTTVACWGNWPIARVSGGYHRF